MDKKKEGKESVTRQERQKERASKELSERKKISAKKPERGESNVPNSNGRKRTTCSDTQNEDLQEKSKAVKAGRSREKKGGVASKCREKIGGKTERKPYLGVQGTRRTKNK